MAERPQVFASRFWGFNPCTHPAVTFGKAGNRDRLITQSQPGDLILFVGTQGWPTSPDEQGRLLGLVEFGRIPTDTRNLIARDAMFQHELEGGSYRWPKALPMLRAWKFRSPPMLRDVLSEQLPMYATVGAVLLSAEDRRAVLAIPRIEAPVRETKFLSRLKAGQDALQQGPTRGPSPTEWTATTTRNLGESSYTYALRFGNRDIWKVGFAADPKARRNQINCHVPTEVLHEEWTLWRTHRWSSEKGAYAMEQRLLSLLEKSRTSGERISCNETEISRAWQSAVLYSDCDDS